MLKIKTKLRKDDNVIIISGKEKGKTGKILKLLPKKSRVVVEKLQFVKKHTRPTNAAPQGGIIEREGSIHISNVALFCTTCNIPTRVKAVKLDDKSISRICIKCDQEI